MKKIKLTNRFYILLMFFIALYFGIQENDIGVAILAFMLYLITFDTNTITIKTKIK